MNFPSKRIRNAIGIGLTALCTLVYTPKARADIDFTIERGLGTSANLGALEASNVTVVTVSKDNFYVKPYAYDYHWTGRYGSHGGPLYSDFLTDEVRRERGVMVGVRRHGNFGTNGVKSIMGLEYLIGLGVAKVYGHVHETEKFNDNAFPNEVPTNYEFSGYGISAEAGLGYNFGPIGVIGTQRFHLNQNLKRGTIAASLSVKIGKF